MHLEGAWGWASYRSSGVDPWDNFERDWFMDFLLQRNAAVWILYHVPGKGCWYDRGSI
jgi:hypothetical protein